MALSLAFASGPCSVHGSDVRVQVSEATYYFPDVTLTCDVADRRRDNKMIRSPSTERADRGSKLKMYQACCDFSHFMAKLVKNIVAVSLGQKPVESKQTLNEFAGYCGSDSNLCTISWQ